jgi:CheY-like chemotaxis protein
MPENSILNNLEYDENAGTLIYKGVRYLLIRPETILEFKEKMDAALGETAKEGFYQGGFSGGYLSSKKYKTVFNFSNRQIIDFMMDMGTQIGWGCFTLDHFDIEKKFLQVSVKNSPFTLSPEKSSKPTCDLIRGVVGGMASIIFNQTCTALESKCVSTGSDICIFVVDLKSSAEDVLKGKKILVVDDEPDIHESITELLDSCVVDMALDFKTAQTLLLTQPYDAVILDIMGVNGYELLEITKKNKIPTLMLTAHALTPENFIKSIKNGAQAYVPKEKLFEIKTFLKDVLTDRPEGGYRSNKWFGRLEKFFNDRFGADWEKTADPEFWKKNNYI